MTTLHPETFNYLQPRLEQMEAMSSLRGAFARIADEVEQVVPDGPDKTYVQRKLREAAMWANVAITRNADGSPRT